MEARAAVGPACGRRVRGRDAPRDSRRDASARVQLPTLRCGIDATLWNLGAWSGVLSSESSEELHGVGKYWA